MHCTDADSNQISPPVAAVAVDPAATANAPTAARLTRLIARTARSEPLASISG
jgi:hypothetical protein